MKFCACRAVFRLSTLMIPKGSRSRYLDEWVAECDAIRQEHGVLSSVLFTRRLVASVPRLGFVLRSQRRPALFDGFIAGLALSVPSLFFTGHALISNQPVVAVAHVLLVLGLLGLARGLWSAESGFLGGWPAKLGLPTIIASSIVITWMNRFSSVDNPVLEGAFVTFPAVILVLTGLVILLASVFCGERRVRAAHHGVLVLMGGLFAWSAIALANALLAPTWTERAYHAVIVPTCVAIIGVCLNIRSRGDELVIPEQRETVIPHR